MPSKKDRINLTLPEDLQKLVQKDADARRLPAATRVMQIIDEHFKREATEFKRNAQVLKGSSLLDGNLEQMIDLSGEDEADEAQAPKGQRSKDAT